jgi:3-oxoacyl-(acyl-carrier-protein) synthase
MKDHQRIFIHQIKAVTPLHENDFSLGSAICFDESLQKPIARIPDSTELVNLRRGNQDRSVALALTAASQLDLSLLAAGCGVNMGSSRGATQIWEEYHGEFMTSGKAPLRTSPLTTLGNLSSQVARFLGSSGPSFSHSITCSTSSHALLNAMAWIRAGMAEEFVVGGAEAPVTGFTIAQMDALGIYSHKRSAPFSLPMAHQPEQNTMVLGEAACCLHITGQRKTEHDLEICGYGCFTESGNSSTGMNADGKGFYQSMLKATTGTTPDVIVTHAPGTMQGDQAEQNAIEKLFGSKAPSIVNNKWQIGHTLGASTAVSFLMARDLLLGKNIAQPDYPSQCSLVMGKVNNVLVNSAGFGGNFVSILLRKADS